MLKLWFQIAVLVVACKQFSGIFTFPGSNAVKGFVITASVNQVSSAKNKFEGAKRLENIFYIPGRLSLFGDSDSRMVYMLSLPVCFTCECLENMWKLLCL